MSEPMKRCGDCRHWRDSRIDPGQGLCAKIGDNNCHEPDAKAIIRVSPARSVSGLITKPDFGCVLFEPEETTNADHAG